MTTSPSSDIPDRIYCPENVRLFEAIYGKNLISLGGFDAVDNMFSGIEIKKLHALDLGFGLGGVAFYLAEKYQMTVSGVDVHPWMAQYAQSHAPKNIAQQLNFNVYTPRGKLPYPAQSFDLVYSKGVLNHVFDKTTLFQQINNVLKPGGLFVIADWIFPDGSTENVSPLVCETKHSYEHILKTTGFHKIEFRDDSKIFLGYVHTLLKTLTQHKNQIENEYDKALFSTLWNQHQELIENINHQRKFAVRIVAIKH